MGNILSYIRWRGDLSFTERQFNEVDNLILAVLSYIDFSGIVPTIEAGGFIRLKDVYDLILEKDKGEIKVHGLFDLPPYFLEELAYSRRFGSAKLFNYKDICDENLQIQFAALHMELEDETVYVAFRGTDQTILGWREDFCMSFQIVPAQQEAVKYLEATMAKNKVYRIGGHSKGGNLAVYGAMMCSDNLKTQIVTVYDNDGPGFCKEMIEMDNYEVIQHKIIRVIPEFSVIGMLFEHHRPNKIVKSSTSGIMQHDAMTWEVEGEHFLEKEDLLPECKALNRIIDTWIKDVNFDQRRTFTKNFFDALGADGAKQINDVASGGIDGFEAILISMVSSEKDTKRAAGKLIKSAIRSLQHVNFRKILKTKGSVRGICIALFGLFFMKMSEHALQIIGISVVFGIFIFAVSRLIYQGTKKKKIKL